jgi:hypothetical protein
MHDQVRENKHNLFHVQRIDEVRVIPDFPPVSARGFCVAILPQPHAEQQAGEKRVIKHSPCNCFCQL